MPRVDYYTQEYINNSRAKISVLLTSYNLVTTAERNDQQLKEAISLFEPVLFNHMVLAMDTYFCHRNRDKELYDGNPLNEVRMLCNSIMSNNNELMADSSINYDSEKSVLKYKNGDKIQVTEQEFASLASAYYDEMEKKFVA